MDARTYNKNLKKLGDYLLAAHYETDSQTIFADDIGICRIAFVESKELTNCVAQFITEAINEKYARELMA